MPLPAAPDYATASLADVLPSVCASLGVPSALGEPAWSGRLGLPVARRAVVVLVDGLGADQLARRLGHAPWLRAQAATTRRVPAGFPSTTATSMGTFGTGSGPGEHGMLGYEVLVPGEDRVFNELSWEDGPDPERWQPGRTWFERAEAAGLEVVRTGPGFFDGSGLTRAALRGGRFAAAESLAGRVDAALRAVRTSPRALVYLYWGEVDKLGHVHGPESFEWTTELESVDRELARLAAGLPDDTSLTVTADHGMVACPHPTRVDVAEEPTLREGVHLLGGEPRATHVYCRPGAAADVAAAWAARLGERAWVLRREEAVAAGWFGPVAPVNLARIGDVVVAAADDLAVVDSARMRPQLLALVGMHGSLTGEELDVPVVHVPARVA
ncbi:alkaline phosphatase family protein [Phycicoccus sonneratiae]|uniref:Alkaline phosphatase family protein n=1 Tax=Phycicoccus sonneratiae TaxID=2807628 RepID=A0ABS2CRR1_9MICO|nr:nucleotide pyrophosphatase/phosphodiesterase family protein [Phycicoccus sonneraticus]MBM6402490.1 alkaline phosphatase family protein [Phycicoccus sonneraticus]